MGLFDFKRREIKGVNATDINHSHFIPDMSFEEFSVAMLNNILGRIINDSLLPIEITSKKDRMIKEVGSNYYNTKEVFEYNKMHAYERTKTLNEIVIHSIYERISIAKVDLGGEHYFISQAGFFTENKINVGALSFDIIEAYMIHKPIYNKDILLAPFKALYGFYVQLDLYTKYSNVVFFKKSNFNAVVDGMQDPQRYEDTLNEAKKTYDNFFKGGGGIIDALDNFEVLSASPAGISEATDFVYTELSRILSIPKSELLGESPTGLNSGGIVQFQTMNYERRLNDYRKRLIEPILQGLKVEYMVSGLSNEDKLELLKEYSLYAPSLELTDMVLFEYSKMLIKDLINDNERIEPLEQLVESQEKERIENEANKPLQDNEELQEEE